MAFTITVFGSSSPSEENYKIAYRVGKIIGKNSIALCNGGYYGTMEASAKGSSEEGGNTIGVTVREFGSTTPNPYIKENLIANTLFERLKYLIEKGDAYIVLPGNTGTLVELSLVWEYYNKGVSNKLILVHSYWKEVINSLEPKRKVSLNLPENYNDFAKASKICKLFVTEDILKGTEYLCSYLKEAGETPTS